MTRQCLIKQKQVKDLQISNYNIYNVFCKGKYIDMVLAFNNEQACKICYVKYGNNSKFSDFGLKNFKAVKI